MTWILLDVALKISLFTVSRNFCDLSITDVNTITRKQKLRHQTFPATAPAQWDLWQEFYSDPCCYVYSRHWSYWLLFSGSTVLMGCIRVVHSQHPIENPTDKKAALGFSSITASSKGWTLYRMKGEGIDRLEGAFICRRWDLAFAWGCFSYRNVRVTLINCLHTAIEQWMSLNSSREHLWTLPRMWEAKIYKSSKQKKCVSWAHRIQISNPMACKPDIVLNYEIMDTKCLYSHNFL